MRDRLQSQLAAIPSLTVINATEQQRCLTIWHV